MSASSIAEAVFVPRAATVTRAGASGAQGGGQAGGVQDALKDVSRYIPSEGLALYIGVAAFAAAIRGAVWVGFVASVVLSVLIVYFHWADERTRSAPHAGRLAVAIAVVLVSQVAYIAALPANPLTGALPNGTLWGGVAVFVLAAFLGVLAPRLGIAPADAAQKQQGASRSKTSWLARLRARRVPEVAPPHPAAPPAPPPAREPTDPPS